MENLSSLRQLKTLDLSSNYIKKIEGELMEAFLALLSDRLIGPPGTKTGTLGACGSAGE